MKNEETKEELINPGSCDKQPSNGGGGSMEMLTLNKLYLEHG